MNMHNGQQIIEKNKNKSEAQKGGKLGREL